MCLLYVHVYTKLQNFLQLCSNFDKVMPYLVQPSSEFLHFTRKTQKKLISLLWYAPAVTYSIIVEDSFRKLQGCKKINSHCTKAPRMLRQNGLC